MQVDSWLAGFCIACDYGDSALKYGRHGGIRNCTCDGEIGALSYRNALDVLVGGPRGRAWEAHTAP